MSSDCWFAYKKRKPDVAGYTYHRLSFLTKLLNLDFLGQNWGIAVSTKISRSRIAKERPSGNHDNASWFSSSARIAINRWGKIILSKFLLGFLSLFDEEAEDLVGVLFWARSEFIVSFYVLRAASTTGAFCFSFGKRK
jgi:hypothetical protein